MSAIIQTIKSTHPKVYMTLLVYPNHVDRVMKVDSRMMQSLLDVPRRNPLSSISRNKPLQDIILDAKRELRELVQTAIRNKPKRSTNKSSVEPKVSNNNLASSVNDEIVVPSPRKKLPKPKSEYSGKLLSYGFAERKMNNKKFKQFCVVLASDELDGHPQKIWGTDLIDAFKNDQYKIGSHLKIVHLGKLPVNVVEEGEQKVKYRNAYSITSSSSY